MGVLDIIALAIVGGVVWLIFGHKTDKDKEPGKVLPLNIESDRLLKERLLVEQQAEAKIKEYQEKKNAYLRAKGAATNENLNNISTLHPKRGDINPNDGGTDKPPA